MYRTTQGRYEALHGGPARRERALRRRPFSERVGPTGSRWSADAQGGSDLAKRCSTGVQLQRPTGEVDIRLVPGWWIGDRLLDRPKPRTPWPHRASAHEDHPSGFPNHPVE